MPDNKFNFTESKLEKLAAPTNGKRLVIYDEGQKGLCIIMTPNGHKSFYVRRTVQGRPVRYHIGVYSEITLATARKRAQDFLSELSDGHNLHAARQLLKQGKTLGEWYEHYLESYSKVNKKSWKIEDYLVKRYVPQHLMALKLNAIRPDDIELLRATVLAKGGKHSMTKLMACLKSVYRFAIDEKEFVGVPPTENIKLIYAEARERFLDGVELTNFLKALEAETNKTYQDFFYLCLLTGARKSNVLEMRWSELDLERASWRIAMTKNGKSLELPLMAEAVDILKERQKTASSIFVFPGDGASGHLADVKKAWAKILARPATFDPKQPVITDLHIHDLRRTLGSWQAMLGTSLLIIGKSLGHKTSRATEIYSRLSTDPVRKSMEDATQKILGFRGKHKDV